MAEQWTSSLETNDFNQIGSYSMGADNTNIGNQQQTFQEHKPQSIQEQYFPNCPPAQITQQNQHLPQNSTINQQFQQNFCQSGIVNQDGMECGLFLEDDKYINQQFKGFQGIKGMDIENVENNNITQSGINPSYFEDTNNNNESKIDENKIDQGIDSCNKLDDTKETKLQEDQLEQNPSGNQDTVTAQIGIVVKRGRGRPRKYPLIAPTVTVPQTDENGQIIPVENQVSLEEEKRQREAESRRKYKEELKKKSQEMVSDEDDSERDDEFDEKKFVPNSQFLKNYRQKLIGRSSNSKIFELKDPGSDQQIGEVVKLVPHKMSNHHQSECGELRNEFKFLKKMDHPHIISLGSNKEFIRDRNFCGIILPQAECNLMQYAKNYRHGKISLSVIRHAFRQIAQAISYLHDNYISHNDIKPDNMFMFSDTDFKLADFGFSVDLPKPNAFKRNSTFSQTLRKQVKIEDLKKNWKQRCKQYVAPELIKLLIGKRPRSASDEKACDVFALGVSFFIIIFYQLPFCGKALPTDQRYKYFFKDNYDKFWQQFSSMFAKFELQENSYSAELKDLFNKMLCPNPENRATIEQILEHPWLQH